MADERRRTIRFATALAVAVLAFWLGLPCHAGNRATAAPAAQQRLVDAPAEGRRSGLRNRRRTAPSSPRRP